MAYAMLPALPESIALANTPTPMRLLSRVDRWMAPSAKPLPKVWLKEDDQSGFILSGNKVRKLEFLLADAISESADVVITCGGIQSNHCRATAFACAQIGIKCHLILREDKGFAEQSTEHQANHFLDQLCGASYRLYSQDVYQSELSQLFAKAEHEFRASGKKSYAIPVGGSNEVGIWGYIAAAKEIVDQAQTFGFKPDAVVCASGSGGTQAGLSLGMHLMDPDIDVVGIAVCDSEQYFRTKIFSDMHACKSRYHLDINISDVQIRTIDRYIGPGYAVAYPEIYNVISSLARYEGVVLDPVYTGKAMHGLVQEVSGGMLASADNIVFVHTGGAFGLFPHAKAFVGG